MDAIGIEPLGPAAFEEAAQLLARAYRGRRCRDTVRYGRGFEELARPLLAEEVGAGLTRIWSARAAGRIVGLEGLRQGDRAELRFLAVDPAAQGRGIGSALAEHTEARARGAREIFLRHWIDPGDDRAGAFLRARGFRREASPDVVLVRPPAPVPEPGDPPPGYSVRTFRAGDEALWEALHRVIFADCAPVRFRDRFRERPGYRFEPEGMWFAFAGEEPVAMAAVVTAGPAVADPPFHASKFDWVGVKEGHRRRGIARHLCLRALRFLAERGRHRVYLDTQLARTGALRFYEGVGFSERFVGVLWIKKLEPEG